MVIGQLDNLKITVYLAEDVYGQISLGDKAEVRVDSYPDDVFEAEVIQIADQAEYISAKCPYGRRPANDRFCD